MHGDTAETGEEVMHLLHYISSRAHPKDPEPDMFVDLMHFQLHVCVHTLYLHMCIWVNLYELSHPPKL